MWKYGWICVYVYQYQSIHNICTHIYKKIYIDVYLYEYGIMWINITRIVADDFSEKRQSVEFSCSNTGNKNLVFVVCFSFRCSNFYFLNKICSFWKLTSHNKIQILKLIKILSNLRIFILRIFYHIMLVWYCILLF